MGKHKYVIRWGQVEVTVNTVQEGCQSIVDAVVEKRTKA